MFSGIIERTARVSSIRRDPVENDPTPSQLVFTIQTEFKDLTLGESIAVNGVCLTVTRLTPTGEADFFVSPETLSRTAFGSLQENDRVNLERALRVDSRLSGHIVQGHVDGIGTVHSIERQGDSHLLQVHLPHPLGKWCIEKGSITLDGISLTLNRVEDLKNGTLISLMIIPHTWEMTTLSDRKPSDLIHIEVDVIAKYVERMTSWKN